MEIRKKNSNSAASQRGDSAARVHPGNIDRCFLEKGLVLYPHFLLTSHSKVTLSHPKARSGGVVIPEKGDTSTHVHGGRTSTSSSSNNQGVLSHVGGGVDPLVRSCYHGGD